MLPDDTCVTEDRFGCPMILVRKSHLQNFPALISWIREKGYGRDRGILKLRLNEEDRDDDSCVRSILKIMKAKSREKTQTEDGHSENLWVPSAQTLFKASETDHIYEYIDAGCTRSERKEFVKKATSIKTYQNETPSCCAENLEGTSLNTLQQHLFHVTEQSAPYLDHVKDRLIRSGVEDLGVKDVSRIIYGSGIPLDGDNPINICEGFSMSSLNTILDLLEEKYDGIAYPYIYAGSPHSYFAWHIEDGGTYSINYVFKGAPKFWSAFAPEQYGLIDKIADSFRLRRTHGSCRSLLGYHKVVIADPEYFKVHHGIPYTTVLQEPGDFVITFPFALHAGFNLGYNLAIAANFADAEWIEWGIYAPVCGCFSNAIDFDLTNILRTHRPDLLGDYIHKTALVFPPGHPREIRPTCVATGKVTISSEALNSDSLNKQEVAHCKQDIDQNESESSTNTQDFSEAAPTNVRSRTLYCPKCGQSFKENKMPRLKTHINLKHSEEAENLIRIANRKYPPWKPKTTRGVTCHLCGKFLRGTKAHLLNHHRKMHSNNPSHS